MMIAINCAILLINLFLCHIITDITRTVYFTITYMAKSFVLHCEGTYMSLFDVWVSARGNILLL